MRKRRRESSRRFRKECCSLAIHIGLSSGYLDPLLFATLGSTWMRSECEVTGQTSLLAPSVYSIIHHSNHHLHSTYAYLCTRQNISAKISLGTSPTVSLLSLSFLPFNDLRLSRSPQASPSSNRELHSSTMLFHLYPLSLPLDWFFYSQFPLIH